MLAARNKSLAAAYKDVAQQLYSLAVSHCDAHVEQYEKKLGELKKETNKDDTETSRRGRADNAAATSSSIHRQLTGSTVCARTMSEPGSEKKK